MKYNSGYVIFDFENTVIDENILSNTSPTNIKKLFSQKNIFKRLSKAIKANKTILITNLICDKINEYPTNTFKCTSYFLNMRYEDLFDPLKFNDSDTILIYVGNNITYGSEIPSNYLYDLKLVVNANDEVGLFA